MKVGTYGDGKYKIKFEVKNKKILSWQNMSIDNSANYDEHQRPGKKPLLEFTGLALGQMSLEVVLKASLGVNPLKTEKMFLKCMDKGKAGFFYISGTKVGSNRWVITSVHRDYISYGRKKGKLKPTEIHLTVNLTEYIYKKAKKKASSKTKTKDEKTKDEKTKTSKDKTETVTPKKKNYTLYTIVKGDTLWAIAKRYYGAGNQYTRIYSANQDGADGTAIISNPNLIYPGWVIKIPS